MGKTWPRRGTKGPKKPRKPAIAALLVALAALSLPAWAAEPQPKDVVFRFFYGYGSREVIPGTITLNVPTEPPPPPPPPVGDCQEKPKPHDCPHSAEIAYPNATAEETTASSWGFSYGRYLTEDVSWEGAVWFPADGEGNGSDASFSVNLDHWFGHQFVPVGLAYRGDLDSFAFQSGYGYEWEAGKSTVLRTSFMGQFLTDSDLSDEWAWSLGFSVGWRLSDK